MDKHKKYVFVDMLGTLILCETKNCLEIHAPDNSPNYEINLMGSKHIIRLRPDAIEFIKKLQEKGYIVRICTSFFKADVQKIKKKLGLNKLGLIRDITGEIIGSKNFHLPLSVLVDDSVLQGCHRKIATIVDETADPHQHVIHVLPYNGNLGDTPLSSYLDAIDAKMQRLVTMSQLTPVEKDIIDYIALRTKDGAPANYSGILHYICEKHKTAPQEPALALLELEEKGLISTTTNDYPDNGQYRLLT